MLQHLQIGGVSSRVLIGATSTAPKAAEIAEGIGFPGAVQVLQLTRTATDDKIGKKHTEVVYAVTSLSVADAKPAQIAAWLRGHWAIENRLRWVRDVTYSEDHSQIRTEGGPQVMATLRNTGGRGRPRETSR